MQPTSSNGSQSSARDVLESLRLVIDKLEADLKQQQSENEQLRAERNEYRRMLVEFVKPEFTDLKQWEEFAESDYTLTIDDLLAVLKSK